MLCLVSNSINYPLNYIGRTGISSSTFIVIIILLTFKLITIMIYFFNSTRKSDKLSHPITICASNEQRALVLAIRNFIKNGLKGEPKIIAI